MNQLSQEEKEKIITRLYWDMKIDPIDFFNLLNKDADDFADFYEIKFYRRLLVSCHWYTLLKLIPLEKMRKLLSDKVIGNLYPKDLKDRYLYARKVLSYWHCDVSTASDSFVRVFLEDGDLIIKIDFINDVPFHYGEFVNSHVFHKIDNWRNILSNKLCALTRIEPKDIADIIFIAKKYSFEWEDIIKEAKEKDLWVEPLEICKTINNFPIRLLIDIKWVNEIDMDEMNDCIKTIHDDIFYGNFNSLK